MSGFLYFTMETRVGGIRVHCTFTLTFSSLLRLLQDAAHHYADKETDRQTDESLGLLGPNTTRCPVASPDERSLVFCAPGMLGCWVSLLELARSQE